MNAFFSKWGICLLLLLATTLNYLDRQTLSILAPTIQREMGLNNSDLGWLFSVFYYSYTFAQFAIGLLLDRFSLRWVYGGAVLAWSATCALTGLANSFATLLLFRLLLGITESANWPGALRIIATTLPPRDRAMGNGIFTSGTSIGALIAPGLITAIAAWYGWRWSFVILGSFGIGWFALWAMFSARVESTAPHRDTAPSKAYAEVLRAPVFWRVFALTILVNPILYYFLNWLPTFLHQTHGVAPGASQAWILTVAYLGLDAGYLACGAMVIAFTRWRLALQTARRTVFLFATVLLLTAAIVPFAQSVGQVAALMVIANFAIGIWIAMYLTLAQEVSPRHVSTAAGLLGGSGSLAGALAMWAVGRVTQETGSFAIPFLAASIMAVLAAVAGYAATRTTPEPFESAPQSPQP